MPQQNRNPINSGNPMNLLSGLMAPNSGFNFANLFGQNRSQPPNESQQQQQNPQPPQQQ